MANSPSRTVLIAGVVVALGAVLLLNNMAQQINPAEQERRAKEQEAKQEAEAAKKRPEGAGSPTPVAPGVQGGGSELVMLGDDTVLGTKGGKPKIVVSYQWTPQVQGAPTLVYNVVQSLQKMAGAQIRVVNYDLHPDAPAPGVYVDEKLITPAASDGSLKLQPGSINSETGGKPGGGTAVPPGPKATPIPVFTASPAPAASPNAATPAPRS